MEIMTFGHKGQISGYVVNGWPLAARWMSEGKLFIRTCPNGLWTDEILWGRVVEIADEGIALITPGKVLVKRF